MKTIKVSEASGLILDWLVAKADDEKDILYTQRQYGRLVIRTAGDHETCDSECPYSPSTEWSQAGPIIEREGVSVLAPVVRRITAERHAFPVECWRAIICRDENEPATHGRGPAPLIAAMRCFVASKLGDTAEVPEGLL
jgi:hypothetical protein